MIQIFGHSINLKTILYVFTLVCAVVIIGLDFVYYFAYKVSPFNKQLLIGIILLVWSSICLYGHFRRQ